MSDYLLHADPWPMSWCVICPHCGETLEDIDNDINTDVKCGYCGKTFHINEAKGEYV